MPSKSIQDLFLVLDMLYSLACVNARLGHDLVCVQFTLMNNQTDWTKLSIPNLYPRIIVSELFLFKYRLLMAILFCFLRRLLLLFMINTILLYRCQSLW